MHNKSFDWISGRVNVSPSNAIIGLSGITNECENALDSVANWPTAETWTSGNQSRLTCHRDQTGPVPRTTVDWELDRRMIPGKASIFDQHHWLCSPVSYLAAFCQLHGFALQAPRRGLDSVTRAPVLWGWQQECYVWVTAVSEKNALVLEDATCVVYKAASRKSESGSIQLFTTFWTQDSFLHPNLRDSQKPHAGWC